MKKKLEQICPTTHGGVPDIAEKGCAAIINLAAIDDNQVKLGRVGACKAVVSALTTHVGVPAVAKNGCLAIINLAVNDDNQVKLGRVGVAKRLCLR